MTEALDRSLEYGALVGQLNALMEQQLAGVAAVQSGSVGQLTQSRRIAYVPKGGEEIQTLDIERHWYSDWRTATFGLSDPYQPVAHHHDMVWLPGAAPQRMVAPAWPDQRVREDVPADDIQRYIDALTTGQVLHRHGPAESVIVGRQIVRVNSLKAIGYHLLERLGLVQTRTL